MVLKNEQKTKVKKKFRLNSKDDEMVGNLVNSTQVGNDVAKYFQKHHTRN